MAAELWNLVTRGCQAKPPTISFLMWGRVYKTSAWRYVHGPLAMLAGIINFVLLKCFWSCEALGWFSFRTTERSHLHQLPTVMIACTFRVIGPGSLACFVALAALSAYATAELAWHVLEWLSYNLSADNLQFVARVPSLYAVLGMLTLVVHCSYLGNVFKLSILEVCDYTMFLPFFWVRSSGEHPCHIKAGKEGNRWKSFTRKWKRRGAYTQESIENYDY